MVFVLILATFLVIAVAGDTGWGGVLTLATLAGALLFTLRASEVSKRSLRRYEVLVVAATLAAVAATLAGSGDTDRVLTAFVAAAFVVMAPVAIVHRLRGHDAITMRTVMGALCVYLFIGLFFSVLYSGIAAVGHAQFFAQEADPSPVEFIYFSFVTLATVGYGDLTAATDLGRMLAVTEGLLGQIYLVTIVAVLVSNLGRRRPARRHSAQGAEQHGAGDGSASSADPEAAGQTPDGGAGLSGLEA